MKSNYNNLLSTFIFPVSGISINNRIVMAPMTTYSGNQDGTASDEEIDYYRHRNQSAGLLISACAYVIPQGKGFPGQIGAHSDAMIPSLNKIATALQENGEKAVLQIHHGGRMSRPEELPDGQSVSASAIAAEREDAQTPREMTEAEIIETIHAYAKATRRAIEAGFDGVEIHGANTYLIQQFFSPHSNRRKDKWGGSIEKRVLFPLAVADAVIETVEKNAKKPFLVGYRISPEEIENPGISIEETLLLVDKLAQRKLDYLHISTMDYWASSLRNKTDEKPLTEHIIKKVDARLPIIGVGSIRTPDQAMKIKDSGADLVALGRELLIDPHWLQKLKSDNIESIETELDLDQQAQLHIPKPMWKMLSSRTGWLPLKK